MAKGELKKRLSLIDLSLLGIGSMIGSGWLYAALNSSGYAGGNTGWAWVLGAVIVLLIGLVSAELSAAIPRAGGFVRYPNYSHGNVVGFVIGISKRLHFTPSVLMRSMNQSVTEYRVLQDGLSVEFIPGKRAPVEYVLLRSKTRTID